MAPCFSAVAIARRAFLVTVSIQSTKRQGNLFVNTNGTQEICTTGSSFVIVRDQLYENGLLITAKPSDGFGALTPGANGTVSGGFAIDGNGIISWSSPSFTNGRASFCLGPDGVIDAIYVQGSQPSDCVPATLSQMSGSNCPGFSPVYPGVAGE